MITTQDWEGYIDRPSPPEFKMKKYSLVLARYLALHDALDRLATNCVMLNAQVVDVTSQVMKAKAELQKLYDQEVKHGQDIHSDRA